MRKIKGSGVGECAVIGRLRRFGGGAACDGEIVFCDRELDVSDIFAFSDEVYGIVAVCERSDALSVALRARGISAVFISQEDAEGISEGERAVIYPDRDMLFIAPKIEIVDDFSTRIRTDILEYTEEETSFFECRELFSGKIVMRAIDAVSGGCSAERAFRLYKKAAEECELQPLLILFGISRIGEDTLRAHINGAVRAAVYTKILFAVTVESIKEYERFFQSVRSVTKELCESGAEIPDKISCGVIIDSSSAAVCIEDYSRAADIIVIDSTSLLFGVNEEERERVLCGYLEVVFERMSGGVREVVVMGDKHEIEKCFQRIPVARNNIQRSYFLMENKNIK